MVCVCVRVRVHTHRFDLCAVSELLDGVTVLCVVLQQEGHLEGGRLQSIPANSKTTELKHLETNGCCCHGNTLGCFTEVTRLLSCSRFMFAASLFSSSLNISWFRYSDD